MLHRPTRGIRRELVRSFVGLGAVFLLAACGDDSSAGGNGAGPVGGGPLAGQGPQGGESFAGCASCAQPSTICVDESSCASGCPSGREVCAGNDPMKDSDPWQICCETGASCCPGVGASYCSAPGEGCPNVCPDGSVCEGGDQCEADAETGVYACVSDCPSARDCGALCCSLGSKCEDGVCPLPDLSIDEDYLVNSAEVVQRTFVEGSCSLEEGCIDALGDRKLLRFSLRTPNTGGGDLFLGDPTGNDLFQYSPCHDHYHFKGYAEYRLLDENGNELALGHKQAFCLLDYDPLEGTATDPQYDCSYQGISKGWSDIYESSLPCQWVDITDVPAGNYQLHIRLNYEHTLAEESFDNNEAFIPIVVEPDSCPNGCRPDDAVCCGDVDTCGWAGDGSCDCGGQYEWDAGDCASCLSCDLVTTCSGGCTLNEGNCCTAANSCGLANNDVCDCEGAQAWDEADCTSCISSDPECANVDTCPNGCAAAAMQVGCCGATDDCGYAGDGWCDCGGTTPWDFADCSNCLSNEPDCP